MEEKRIKKLEKRTDDIFKIVVRIVNIQTYQIEELRKLKDNMEKLKKVVGI
jgi:hypothetical protein